MAPLHARGQAGHGMCQEQLLLLLVVHMCCRHSPSPPNPAGGVQRKQTQQQQPAGPKRQHTWWLGAESSRDSGFRVGAAESRADVRPVAPRNTRQPCDGQACGCLHKLGYFSSRVMWKAMSQRKSCAFSQKKKREERKEGGPIKHFLPTPHRFTALAPLIWLLGFIFNCLIHENVSGSVWKCADYFRPLPVTHAAHGEPAR